MIKDWLSKITDRYTKDQDSNIGKVLHLISDEVDDLSDTLNTVEHWKDLSNAKGATLDLIGADFSQPRGQTSDEIYRSLIIAKIVQNQSDGTYDKMIEAIALTLGCTKTDVSIRSLVETGDDEPAAVSIEKAPLARLSAIGLSGNQFVQIVQKIVGAGIRVSRVNLSGTFRFANAYDSPDISVTYGFGTIYDQVDQSGGLLGELFDDNENNELPI
ncbi:hypothetical protein [Sporolactobacillus laevolacticus]|uniref:DUF2612 domain-containing protein n=1 Tax=Sporolactobacillus laevolacticus DSM 442 TaxID=1395513 RepID=V6IXG7_9BACL|nr:hypothetical protein [Sporolactobacillus laevolacticus]EST12037.1 hypothetical protein P343_07890 [Sporolactobacillus laevolacticus DSM 442]